MRGSNCRSVLWWGRALRDRRQAKLEAREAGVDRSTKAVRPLPENDGYLARRGDLKKLNGDGTHQTVSTLSILLVERIDIRDTKRGRSLGGHDDSFHGSRNVDL